MLKPGGHWEAKTASGKELERARCNSGLSHGTMATPHCFTMARFRIVRRPSGFYPDQAVYDVEQRVWWWWETPGIGYLSLEGAQERVEELKRSLQAAPIKREIVKEYD
jgi:hypothetical protein